MEIISKQAKIAIWIFSAVLILCGLCILYVSFMSVLRNDRLMRAQEAVYKAQEENVGKPQVIEQRYYSPNCKEYE